MRAGFVSRLAAFFVDAVIVAVTLRATTWLLGGAAAALGRFAPPLDPRSLVVAALPLLVAVYNVAFWRAAGATPGKLLLGLKVIPVGGGRLGVGRALARVAGYVLSALPCYAGFLWILGPDRRAWHDRLARTEVVYARRERSQPDPAARLRRTMRALGPAAAVTTVTTSRAGTS